MAITPLTSPYKSLTFDGETSASYGVQILGEGVFDAPKRDVDMIEIPGRNGAYALDKGRFENITVTYPANLIADSTTDFADGISAFRNFLCSKKGYVRLSDDYNPNEYRMAIYKSGLEVDEKVLRAGEFDIEFECMPQRWLTSGETQVSLSDGEAITNPTLFDASPLLEVEGYGNVGFNNYEIEIEAQEMGTISLWEKSSYKGMYTSVSKAQTIPSGVLNTSDAFTIDAMQCSTRKGVGSNSAISVGAASATCSGITGASATAASDVSSSSGYYTAHFDLAVSIPAISFVYGTSKTETCSTSFSGSYTISGNTTSVTYSHTISISYDGNDTVTFTWTNSEQVYTTFAVPSAIGVSTVQITGYAIYIDCDLGEAYMIKNGSMVSLNEYIDVGSDMPKLAPGSNTVSYDNTITSFKMTPRWWKV